MLMTLPSPKALKDVVDGLLGRDVVFRPEDVPMSSVDSIGGVVAVYVDDARRPRAVLGWDLPAAARAGTAFALIPARMAEEIIADRYLPADVVESVYELSNVIAGALYFGDNPHLRLDELCHPAAALPDELAQALYTHFERLDFVIEVPGYGPGRIALVAV